MLSLGAIIALSTLSVSSITIDDIHRYEVERWGGFYQVDLISPSGNNLGQIILCYGDDDMLHSVSVDIPGTEYYVAVINHYNTYSIAEFKDHGETYATMKINVSPSGSVRVDTRGVDIDGLASSFNLIHDISSDPSLRNKFLISDDPQLDSISSKEAAWCGVGSIGASIVSTPAGGFFYGVGCLFLADMDSWGSGGVTSGGSPWTSASGCRGCGEEIMVIRKW